MDTNVAGIFAFALTIVLVLLIVLLTTPLIAVNYLKIILIEIGIKNDDDPNDAFNKSVFSWAWIKYKIMEYSSPILVLILDKLVPWLVEIIQSQVPRTTKSAKQLRLLQICFFFIFVTGYIAPSIGLQS